MINWEIFWPFLFFATVSTLTPGANNVLVFLYTLYFGVKKAIIFRLGVFVGFPGMCWFVVMFLQPLFNAYPQIIDYFNYAGAILMCYIAYKVAFALPDFEANKTDKTFKPMGFWGGIMFQLINGKAWAMAFIGASVFTNQADPVLTQATTVWLGFVLANIYCTIPWIVLPFYGKDWLLNPKRLRIINYIFAITIVWMSLDNVF